MMDEIKTVPAIVQIPINTVGLTIIADIYTDNKEVQKAECTYQINDIRDIMIDGEDWERDNVKYCLTDKAREEIEKYVRDQDDE